MPYEATLADSQLIPPPPMPDSAPRPIAHWLHTVGLVVLLGFTTWLGQSRASQAHTVAAPILLRYGSTIVLEWILLGLVIAGIYQRRQFVRTALFSRATTLPQTLGFGLMVYFIGFVSIALISSIIMLTPLAHERNVAYVLAMLPDSPLQFLFWFGVSFSAGFCEELIFRGYLLQQITAWTRKPILGIFLAALLFGSVHLYEGLGAILPLAALAVVYGFVVRYFKGDLRAVIIAHTLQDFLVGFLGLARPFLERYQHLQ